jgi:hypothetical protein
MPFGPVAALHHQKTAGPIKAMRIRTVAEKQPVLEGVHVTSELADVGVDPGEAGVHHLA